MKPLYKTTIIIWTDYSVTDEADVEMFDNGLELLAREATSGDAYCSKLSCQKVDDPQADPDWDNTEFFDDPTEDEEEVG